MHSYRFNFFTDNGEQRARLVLLLRSDDMAGETAVELLDRTGLSHVEVVKDAEILFLIHTRTGEEVSRFRKVA